jgi:predicted nucleotidyltransferase
MTTKVAARIPLPYGEIERFCQKWNVTRFEVFGSVLRDDFDPDRSDVDVLVTFAPGKTPGLAYFGLEDELAGILRRPVHLSTRRSVEENENWIRRESILRETQTVYERR